MADIQPQTAILKGLQRCNMKRIVSLFLSCTLVFCLCACTNANGKNENMPSDQPTVSTENPTDFNSDPAETTDGLDQAPVAETTTPNTVPTEPMREVPYTNELGASVAIYTEPNGSSTFVQNVGQDGVYTIVEEAYDSNGNLWGRLKSGLGWVNLTMVRTAHNRGEVLSCAYADEQMPSSADYHICILDSSEYAFWVAFQASQSLTDIRIVSLEFENSGNGYKVGDVLYTLDQLTPEKPLAVKLSFPGDFSVYGILFTDSNGIEQRRTVCKSGEDGSLIMSVF